MSSAYVPGSGTAETVAITEPELFAASLSTNAKNSWPLPETGAL